MKKNYIVNIKLALISMFALSSLMNAEIADRTYLKLIERVEELIPGLKNTSDVQRESDIATIKKNLSILRAGTKSWLRLRRINKAVVDFDSYQNRTPASNRGPVTPPEQQPEPVVPKKKQTEKPQPKAKPKKTVTFKDKPEVIPAPKPNPKSKKVTKKPELEGKTPEQQLETLLLYAQNLVDTSDVSRIVKQKENAESNVDQATKVIPTMRTIIMQHPELAERFIERVQRISDRIEKTLEEMAI